jgi:signal transduction histidine kinase
MRYIPFLLLFFSSGLLAQNTKIDSLKHLLAKEKSDTVKVRLLNELAQLHLPDTANIANTYLQNAMELSNRNEYEYGRLITLTRLAEVSFSKSDYPKSLSYGLSALELAERRKDTSRLLDLYRRMVFLYRALQDPDMMLEYARKRHALVKPWSDKPRNPEFAFIEFQIFNMYGYAFELLKKMDSARFYRRLAYPFAKEQKNNTYIAAFFSSMGSTYIDENPDSALYYFRLGAQQAIKGIDSDWMSRISIGMAKVYSKKGMTDSAFYYGHISLKKSGEGGQITDLNEAAILLHQLYARKKQFDSAYMFLSISSFIKDSLFGYEKIKEIQALNYNERTRIAKQAQAKIDAQARAATNLKLILLAAGAGALLLFVLFLVRNNRQKQKANVLLRQQKEKVEAAMQELKTVQAQLEKMASLGELTAGIAHEIQNPLNFVNNFSEANKELVAEAREELVGGNFTEVEAILDYIEQNEAKISHHGKRADNIVKGMLQHSRQSDGVKEATNINQLVEECLRLSYHGFRAKNPSFTAVVETHYNEAAGNLVLVPQDISRVLLNLLNNAFYAVHQKKQQLNGQYEPVVSVTTNKKGNYVVVSVSDNGTGMPKKVAEKVFQPFFTTKPTGEGTGLGLSLSYDIITKGHGGHLKVDTKEGEGSEFIIQLLVNE